MKYLVAEMEVEKDTNARTQNVQKDKLYTIDNVCRDLGTKCAIFIDDLPYM